MQLEAEVAGSPEAEREKSNDPLLTVIVPAYNEAPRIANSLVKLATLLRTAGVPAEILVVDDGSTDSTRAEAEKAMKELNAGGSVIGYARNRGMGHAVRAGAERSHGEWIAVVSADQDENPACVRRFLQCVADGEVDVVVGSKWHPGSEVEYPFHRRILSYAYCVLVHLLFCLPLRDTQGPMLVRGELGRQLFARVKTDGFAFSVEFLAQANREGARIAEVPITVRQTAKPGRRAVRSVFSIFVSTVLVARRLRVENLRARSNRSSRR